MEIVFGYFCVVLVLDVILFLAWLFKTLVVKGEPGDCIVSLAILHIAGILMVAGGLMLLKN